MKVIAPGKLVLTGAYAVLEGAPAIVLAVNRYAVADSSRPAAAPAAEVRAAFADGSPPDVDVHQLQDARGRKLGLGSSAAAVVAALGVQALARLASLDQPAQRAALFRVARAAHAAVQGGGSGVDVAASVHGGALRYALGEAEPSIRAVSLPRDLRWAVYFSGESARTSDLRARVHAARRSRPAESARLAREMAEVSLAAADALDAASAVQFVAAAARFGELLGALGRLADASIFPRPLAELSVHAGREGAAFFPSGAGGGDVSVWLGVRAPSESFAARAGILSLTPLALEVDRAGVRPHPDDVPPSSLVS